VLQDTSSDVEKAATEGIDCRDELLQVVSKDEVWAEREPSSCVFQDKKRQQRLPGISSVCYVAALMLGLG
jgi:hypothetical protein